MFKKFMEQREPESKVVAEAASEISEQPFKSLVISRIRVCCFDGFDLHAPKIRTPTRETLIDTHTRAAVQEMLDESTFAQRAIVVVEFGLKVSNHEQNVAQSEEDDLVHQPDSTFYLSLEGLQIYLNQTRATMGDLILGNLKKQMLLYPVDVQVEQKFYTAKNFSQLDVDVSLVEIEVSFKQLFFMSCLAQKIQDAVKPFQQVLE
jgi:hypothetical protein